MMTFKPGTQTLFTWVFLPDEPTPVVAGRIDFVDQAFCFTYGRRFLERQEKSSVPYALYPEELPLQRGQQFPNPPMQIASCLRDSAPDAWGRRVAGYHSKLSNPDQLNELDYLLLSGSDRIGNLDFQTSATDYAARDQGRAKLEELLMASEYIESNKPLPQALDRALLHGTSIGGARPKALITHHDSVFIAKFTSTGDLYPIVKAEYLTMRLAQLCGLNVAQVRLLRSAGKDVLLVERFDRHPCAGGVARKSVLSGLTLLQLDELQARYASYEGLAHVIRNRFKAPKETLKELFKRLVFNVLCGNTDDHARNHAAFWDGQYLQLTPAYDLCPQLRTGGEASQAMAIRGADRRAQLVACVAAHNQFLLTEPEARQTTTNIIQRLQHHWQEECDAAGLTVRERDRLASGAFMHPYAFEGWDD